ncbi:MAG TPA: NAD(P)-dependent oxidoreductase [Tepidisphaeraceae bacterium]|nr:NAD(P)-dependent oxidoreductase [Tepidisphaeraceae bacterium]
MPHAYPLMLDVTDRLVVVVGGGAVAVRKIRGLLDAGATRVRVVAPEFHAEMPAGIERVAAAYESSHLDAAQLVFATTDSPETNERVARDARDRGIWINRSDEGGQGDFATPARWAEGDVIVTVAAGSAALSTAIRDDLIVKLDRRYVKLAAAMKTLRPAVRIAEADPQRRAAIFRDLASAEALDAVDRSGAEGVRDWLRMRHPNLWS